MKQRIPYTKPSITELEIRYATDAAANGWGERCYDYIHRFENAFKEHLGVQYAIATSSCTGALHMGMAALGIGPGDEVILPDTTWIATAAPIVHLGAKPVLVDILEDTWCIDPEKAEAAITPRTKAIIAVIGLGYVGLPLAVEFGKRYPVLGFDIKPERITELQAGRDSTLEVPPEELATTGEICVPVLEQTSGLKFNTDFYCGYSPERINPGDKAHRLTTIKKVTSGSAPEAADVLEAAGTKWNFLPFRPGLVGGHCIGVDPYYLTHKAQAVGYHPEVILAGRRINDGMGEYVAEQVIKLMIRRGINPVGARVLVLGLTFKENCPDLRNTKVVDVVRTLRDYRAQVDVHDPLASADEAQHEYGLALLAQPQPGNYDAIVLAVAHRSYLDMGVDAIRAWLKPEGVLYDVKSVLPRDGVEGRL